MFPQHVDDVLDADRNPAERKGDVCIFGFLKGGFDVAGEVGTDLMIGFGDAGFDRQDGVGWSKFSTAEAGLELGDGEI